MARREVAAADALRQEGFFPTLSCFGAVVAVFAVVADFAGTNVVVIVDDDGDVVVIVVVAFDVGLVLVLLRFRCWRCSLMFSVLLPWVQEQQLELMMPRNHSTSSSNTTLDSERVACKQSSLCRHMDNLNERPRLHWPHCPRFRGDVLLEKKMWLYNLAGSEPTQKKSGNGNNNSDNNHTN